MDEPAKTSEAAAADTAVVAGGAAAGGSSPTDATGRRDFYVVGIGASAGGLAALRAFFDRVPAKPGVAFVVVTHLSPEHESVLHEVLRPCTSLAVEQVTQTTPIERDRVYVIPPNANLSAIDTHLRLSELEHRRGTRAQIDHFFGTLAATHDGSSVGVVLTGVGSDGALGLRRIKESGGLAIAQDPLEAEYDGMPRAAIATGMVDLVLPLGEMPAAILAFCTTHPRLPDGRGGRAPDETEEATLARIIAALEAQDGNDYGMFSSATLLARIRKRMQLTRVETLEDYAALLERCEEELQTLRRDLQQHVTEFFRAPDLFERIGRRVLPILLDRKRRPAEHLRIWSIGCSTGEEAYSVTMLALEALAERAAQPRLRVFATDLSAETLRLARTGIYPQTIAASVSAARLERFFELRAGSYHVRREVRDLIVFAEHNLFRDPPYTRLDMILCRTLLHELQPEVRGAVLRMFHYALEPDGFLVLDERDAIDLPGLFERDQGGEPIFRRVGSMPLRPSRRPALRPGCEARWPDERSADPSDVAALHYQALERFTPPSVLVDVRGEVVHYSSHAAEFLRIPGGELTHRLVELVLEPLRHRLERSLRSVRRSGGTEISEPLTVHTLHGPRQLRLRVGPADVANTSGLLLVVFDDLSSQDPSRFERVEQWRVGAAISRLEGELIQTNQRLGGLTEDLAAHVGAGGVAQAPAGGELVALHVLLERLEHAREKLGSLGGQLAALDAANRRRLEELTRLSNDLDQLLGATGIATLFLDHDLRVLRFTPRLMDLFDIGAPDVGRPFGALAHRLAYDELAADAARVLEQHAPVEHEAATDDGRFYLVQMIPYHAAPDRAAGIVMNFVDITGRKRAEDALREADERKSTFLALLAHELRNPLAPISSGVLVLKNRGGDAQIVDKIARMMERQSQQLTRLVEDLLDVARIEGGRLQLQRTVVDLSDLLKDALATVQPLMEQYGHRLEVQWPQERLLLHADRVRVAQILANLLNNAARYTPHGGRIELRAQREGDCARVDITDSGIGIPERKLGHIFEMFYRGDDASVARTSGLGIGLGLARQLVDLHGGTISAASAGSDRGSTFTVRLPLADAGVTAVAGDAPPVHDPRLDGHRILVVDDNEDAAEGLAMLVGTLGTNNDVRIALSGAEALELGPQLQPDVVLLDLGMPGMDGYEVATRIRRQPWGSQVALVAVSGWGQPEQRRRTREAGFDLHLTKPADRGALAAVLADSQPPAA